MYTPLTIFLSSVFFSLCATSQQKLPNAFGAVGINKINKRNPNNHNNQPNTRILPPSNSINAPSNLAKRSQSLTLIGYASDAHPARHLQSFAKQYNLDFHLIGTDRPWGGFNDKIQGFYDSIHAIDNKHNDSVILILDAYDTVPICDANDLLSKFNSFDADIVISTGKDCWPDPNVADFLMDHLSDSQIEKYDFLPWFLCPNSGAIMGKHDAMLSMFKRVQQLVSLGNGSCNDFEGNHFTKYTQSDQRCYTTYYVELIKFKEIYAETGGNADGVNENGVIDISVLSQYDRYDPDQYIATHLKELAPYYKDITMKLDHETELFVSMGGMLFMDFVIDVESKQNVTLKCKLTNGSACIMHGNGPGIILFRSFLRQIAHNGKLYVNDWVLRLGSDWIHWCLWWIMMPCERLSHWLSLHFHFDIGMHSTTFSEEAIWQLHILLVLAVVLLSGMMVGCWYKFRFMKNMKRNRRNTNTNANLRTNQAITQQFLNRLSGLEIRIASGGAEKND